MAASPCINICKIDPKTNICMGCGRNMKEISDWINMSDLEKEKLLLDLKDGVNKE
jgi:predicted Fe-S protein YdhL (DUF1289 family)